MKQIRDSSLKKLCRAYLSNESGATAIEYALIAALIGVGIIGGLNVFSGSSESSWNGLATKVDDAFS